MLSNPQKELPIFIKDQAGKNLLQEIISAISKNTKLYLYGGAARNSIYHLLLNEELPQRDWDIILIGNREPFVQNLVDKGWIFGKKNNERAVVLKKPRKENPSTDFADWVVLDIVIRQNITIEDVLDRRANFTINGVGIDLEKTLTTKWQESAVAVPKALEDLTNKQIRVLNYYPINIYACIRFIALGFRPPAKEEIDQMIIDLKQIDDESFERDTKKVLEYLGSSERVQKISQEIGIRINILDLFSIRNS